MPQKNLFIDVEPERTEKALSEQEFDALKDIAKREGITVKELYIRIFREFVKNYGLVKFAKRSTKDKK